MKKILNQESTNINLATGFNEIDEFCLEDFGKIAKIEVPCIELQNISWEDLLRISSSVWENIDKFESEQKASPIFEKDVEPILKLLYAMYIRWFCENVYRFPPNARVRLAVKVDTSLDAIRNYAKTIFNIDIKKHFLLDLLEKNPPAYPALLIFLPKGSKIIGILEEEIISSFDAVVSQWEYKFAYIIKCQPYPQNISTLQAFELLEKSITEERGICIKLYNSSDERLYQKIFENRSFLDQTWARGFDVFEPFDNAFKGMFQFILGGIPETIKIFSEDTNKFLEYVKNTEQTNDYYYEITKFSILALSKYLELESLIASNIENKDIVYSYMTPFARTYNALISMRNYAFT